MTYSLSSENQISERLIRKLVRTWRCGGEDGSTAWLERRQRANRAVDVLKMFSSRSQFPEWDAADASGGDEIDLDEGFRRTFVD